MDAIPPALRPWVLAWAAVAGAAVGSFLNVVVARVPAGESVVHPRSRCPSCRTPIAWYDNVPVIAWILLRGRCRACGTRIALRYPLVELAVAGVAVVAVRRHGLTGTAAAEVGFVAVLLALALIDLDTWLLPNALTWPLIVGGIAVAAAGASPAGSLRSSLVGAGLGFASFAAVSVVGERVFRKEALGFGDVWLLAGLGAFLGVGALLPVVLLASIQGVAIGGTLALLGKLPGGKAESPPPPAPGETATTGPEATPAAPGDPASAGDPGTPDLEDDWVPPRHAVPFGPFLVAAALEWLYLSGTIAHVVPALEIFR